MPWLTVEWLSDCKRVLKYLIYKVSRIIFVV